MRFWVITLTVVGFVLVLLFAFAILFFVTLPSRELNREMDWLKANKLPTKIDELLPSVPASQNAAPLYRKAFAAMKLSKDEESWLSKQLSRKLILSGQVDWTKLKQVVERNHEATELVHQAALLPHLRLTNWHKENPLDIEFPHFFKMRNLARLLAADAMLKKREGDIEGAARNCVTTFKMAKHLSDDVPTVIGSLVSMAIFSQGYRALEMTLADAKVRPQSYRSLIEALSSLDFAKGAVRAWQGERASGLAVFKWLEEAPYQKRLERLKKVIGLESVNELSHATAGSSGVIWQFILDNDRAVYLWAMRGGEEELRVWLLNGPAPSQPEAKKLGDQFKKEFQKRLVRRMAIISVVLTSLSSNLGIRAANHESMRRVALTAVALRLYSHEHGRYPKSLRELVPKYLPSVPLDPFTNKPIQYRRTEKGFVVWSIGWDGKDDGGKLRLDEHKWEKGDIVWESFR